MLKQIVYYSISVNIIDKDIISDILYSSRINNKKNDITGCLLYHNNVFLQLLEGEKKDVDDLFDVLKSDKRHSNVTLIIEESIEDRMFPDWSMAYRKLEKPKDNLDKFVQSIDFFSKNVPKKTEAIDLFWRMARQIVVK